MKAKAKALIERLGNWRVGVIGVAVAAVVGAIATVSTSAMLEFTNSEGFCIGCHEMRPVYEEYKTSVHASNRTGVRAVCADCHVPRDFAPKMIRKVQATREIWAKAVGKIDTPEKFERHRYDLALTVWTYMKKTDSRECRACHDSGAMNFEHQSARAKVRHERALRENITCIDCHFAIAHKEPEGDLGPQDIAVK